MLVRLTVLSLFFAIAKYPAAGLRVCVRTPLPSIPQMASKADNDEVLKALSTVGNKLKKIGVIIPAIQEELSTKIDRNDLSK